MSRAALLIYVLVKQLKAHGTIRKYYIGITFPHEKTLRPELNDAARIKHV